MRLLSYVWNYKSRLVVVLFALTGLTFFQLLGPKLVAYAIDQGIDPSVVNGVPETNGSTQTLLIAGALIVAAAIARGSQFFKPTWEFISQRVAYDIGTTSTTTSSG
jgi:ABC-type multidrug transport system fused ATPase/permease subunit